MSNNDHFTTTYPVYKNAKGNIYLCGKGRNGINDAYQIKNGKIWGPMRVMSFLDSDFIGTITVDYYYGKTISQTFAA
jgi:hypothetical protein